MMRQANKFILCLLFLATIASNTHVFAKSKLHANVINMCNGEFTNLYGVTEPSRGCVVETTQVINDKKTETYYKKKKFDRRYIIYAPDDLPNSEIPVVLVFHGYSANAEAMANSDTLNRFETLADKEKFIVVYPNALPPTPGIFGLRVDENIGEQGYFQGCAVPHDGEHVDVKFTRQILGEIEKAGFNIDSERVYATGYSAGGGMSLLLAIEAPDLVAAIAPVVPLPYHFSGEWKNHCNPAEEVGTVPIVFYTATSDTVIPYDSAEVEGENFTWPGIENIRDSWLKKMGISNDPTITRLDDIVKGDSYEKVTGTKDSYIDMYTYEKGNHGVELTYYKAYGAGHTWPNPKQLDEGAWPFLGKRNQDIDFADIAWEFFSRH